MGQSGIAHLLVVDDSRAYLHLLRSAFLEHHGKTQWEVAVAEDGEEAMRQLFSEGQQNLPDLILLAWNLPRIGGDEVLRRVKEHSRLRRIPVFVLSTSEADGDVQAAYDYHANGYITKPSSLERLEAMIETIERFWVLMVRLPKVSGTA